MVYMLLAVAKRVDCFVSRQQLLIHNFFINLTSARTFPLVMGHFLLPVLNRFKNHLISLPFCRFSYMETRSSKFVAVDSCGTQTLSFFRSQLSSSGLKPSCGRCLPPWRYHGYSCVGIANFRNNFNNVFFVIDRPLRRASFTPNESERTVFGSLLSITRFGHKWVIFYRLGQHVCSYRNQPVKHSSFLQTLYLLLRRIEAF